MFKCFASVSVVKLWVASESTIVFSTILWLTQTSTHISLHSIDCSISSTPALAAFHRSLFDMCPNLHLTCSPPPCLTRVACVFKFSSLVFRFQLFFLFSLDFYIFSYIIRSITNLNLYFQPNYFIMERNKYIQIDSKRSKRILIVQRVFLLNKWYQLY